MKATSWRALNSRIKSRTLARYLIQFVTAKEVKTNNRRLLSHMNEKKKKVNILWNGSRNEV